MLLTPPTNERFGWKEKLVSNVSQNGRPREMHNLHIHHVIPFKKKMVSYRSCLLRRAASYTNHVRAPRAQKRIENKFKVGFHKDAANKLKTPWNRSGPITHHHPISSGYDTCKDPLVLEVGESTAWAINAFSAPIHKVLWVCLWKEMLGEVCFPLKVSRGFFVPKDESLEDNRLNKRYFIIGPTTASFEWHGIVYIIMSGKKISREPIRNNLNTFFF
jgi:hypothetical protein